MTDTHNNISEKEKDMDMLDAAIQKGNWTDKEIEILENLTLEQQNEILKRFSQEELRTSNGILTQAETILSRGDGKTNNGDTQKDSRARSQRQEQKIESWAKENGLWYNSYQESSDGSLESVLETDGAVFSNNSGSESMVYWTLEGAVIKAIDASHYNDTQGLLDKIMLHNALFPETKLEVMGFGRDRGNAFRIIVKQDFVEGSLPTIEDVQTFAENLGFAKERGWYYTKEGKRISDLNPKNIIKASNGAMLVIDCDVELV